MKIIIFPLLLLPLFLPGSEFKDKRKAQYPAAKCMNILTKSRDPMIRRSAFRAMMDDSQTAINAVKYIQDQDDQIRLAAYNYLLEQAASLKLNYLKQGFNDPSPQIRMFALRRIKDYAMEPGVNELIEKLASTDSDHAIRQYAGELSWPFYRENKLLRNDPSWDQEIVSVKTFAVPDVKWLFSIDDKNDGYRKGYFRNDFDDRSWKPIKIGNWEKQGWPDYDGIAWYRIRFNMPAKMDSNAVELHFEAVDESAWVWLNGIYVGEHDIGAGGWNVPFRLDATKEVKWGMENIMTVRVLDRGNAGGIWKPVNVDILK